MQALSETGFLRLNQVLEVIPVSRSTWWAGVKDGRFPKPVKLSPRCTAWRAKDVLALAEKISAQSNEGGVAA